MLIARQSGQKNVVFCCSLYGYAKILHKRRSPSESTRAFYEAIVSNIFYAFWVKLFDSVVEWVYHVVVGNWHSVRLQCGWNERFWHVFSIWHAYGSTYKLRISLENRCEPSVSARLRRKRVTFAGRESIDFRKLVLI